MNMINLFLRFTDESEWRDFASDRGFLTDDGLDFEGAAVNVLGELCSPGTYDDDGNELTAPTPKPGYHVNWKAEPDAFPAGITAFEVMPDTAENVWAGDPVSLSDRKAARAAVTIK